MAQSKDVFDISCQSRWRRQEKCASTTPDPVPTAVPMAMVDTTLENISDDSGAASDDAGTHSDGKSVFDSG